MKTIVVYVLSIVALTKAAPPPFFQFIAECKGSATDADIAAIMTHPDTLPANAYCVLGCAMKKAGMMTASNGINMENLANLFGPIQQKRPEVYQGLIGIFESCKPTGTLSECEAAKFIYECSEPKIKQVMPMPGRRPH